LPKDVAALVSSVDKDAITLTLCNLHPLESRKLIVQAGAFAEHHFDRVSYTFGSQDDNNIRTLDVNGRWFEVELTPGSLVELDVAMHRCVHQPSYVEPFDAG